VTSSCLDDGPKIAGLPTGRRHRAAGFFCFLRPSIAGCETGTCTRSIDERVHVAIFGFERLAVMTVVVLE